MAKKNVEYLENPTGMRGQNTKYRALSYIIVGNELFKKTPKGVLLICLSETKAYLAIYDIHTRACDAHRAGHKMKWFSFRQGLY